MASPLASATSAVDWSIPHISLRHLTLPVARLKVPLYLGPVTLLAKFPHGDPPGDLVPVLLGLEFFLTHQAEFTLFPPPQRGVLRLP